MNFTVVGPGALGCLFASMLVRAGNTVCILDHDETRAANITDQGLVLKSAGKELRLPILATTDPAVIGRTEVVLLCVKSYDVEAALEHLKPLLLPDTLLIAMQNGVGHHEALARAVCFYAVGISSQGGTSVGMGTIIHGGSGQTVLGYLPTTTKKSASLLVKIAQVLSAAGLQASVSDRIIGPIWDKLVINVGINALSAIHDCCNGDLLEDASLLQVQKLAVKEAVSVATELGIVLTGNPLDETVKVCRATRKNVSSMLQDVRKGRRTEIDAINGAIVREGKRLGVATPVNKRLVYAVQAVERA